MAYQATVIPVMIASPGDVLNEKRAVREILYLWNDVNSREAKAMLAPVSWETHSAPELGGRPQELINRRVLKGCDLLVGIFWTRLGTPTGKAASGTVEEIQEHMSTGKPAMIYFSRAPVVLDSVDPAQYEAVREFKQWTRSQGLVHEYDDPEDFERQFRRHLPLILKDNAHLRELLSPGDFIYPPAVILQSLDDQLSEEARELLYQGANSTDGQILRHESLSGVTIFANRRSFGGGADPRIAARWEAALHQLVDRHLVEAVGSKGVVYRIRSAGFETVDRMAGSSGASDNT
jgi:hypothetical protein